MPAVTAELSLRFWKNRPGKGTAQATTVSLPDVEPIQRQVATKVSTFHASHVSSARGLRRLPLRKRNEPRSVLPRRMNIAIFASGGGSNFQAIADACADGSIPARVVLCVASRPEAGVISRARAMGIPYTVIDGAAEDWGVRLLTVLHDRKVDLVALAGFMRKIPPSLIEAFPDRILNIHPSLLPEFGGQGMYGMNVHRAVIASGRRVSGATVHMVDEGYDTGPVILQERVAVRPDDGPEELAARVLSVEHRLYPSVIKAFSEGRVHREGRTVHIRSEH